MIKTAKHSTVTKDENNPIALIHKTRAEINSMHLSVRRYHKQSEEKQRFISVNCL